MSIYRPKYVTDNNRDSKIHRKIYEQHFGPIPIEPDGRSYHIHHLDGDHDNNDPSNLTAITAQEHYNMHYAQGDYGACLLLKTYHLDHTPEERSELARIAANQRIENGTHPWQGDDYAEAQRQRQLQRVEDGTHVWLGGEIQRASANQMVLDGRHAWVGPEHNLKQLAEGTHCSQIMVSCIYCKDTTDLFHFRLWHGDRCKDNPDSEFDPAMYVTKQIESGKHASQLLVSCIYCQRTVDKANFNHWHGDNCKLNPANYVPPEPDVTEITRGCKGTIWAQDHQGVNHRVLKNDPRLLSGELEKATLVRDMFGNFYRVKVTDPLYLSKYLRGFNAKWPYQIDL